MATKTLAQLRADVVKRALAWRVATERVNNSTWSARAWEDSVVAETALERAADRLAARLAKWKAGKNGRRWGAPAWRYRQPA